MSPLKMKFAAAMSAVAMLGACGGGDSNGTLVTTPGAPTSSPTPGTPTPTNSACTLAARKQFVRNALNEYYLFPETLPASLDPAPYPTVQDYIDALTATARSQGRDRNFTFITSIAEEDAFFSSGSSAGFGVRLVFPNADNRLFVSEAFENAPALPAGLDRGTEILAIGTSANNLRTIADIIAQDGPNGVGLALGPSTAGTTRVFRIQDAGGTRVTSVTKADYNINPVSTRYGAKVITSGGGKVGYINLRTFISSADDQLRSAIAGFRAQGVTNLIIDLRYNGGGLVNTAELFGDLLGGNRSASDVFSYTTFRASKSSLNESRNFMPQPQSIAPMKIAFIGTGSTASASELLINAMAPYVGEDNVALIGSNTFGKPVGQIGLDLQACDDRLRVVAFRTENRDRRGDYYGGLADVLKRTCDAADDITHQLGDPQEESIMQALNFLNGGTCTPITSGVRAQSAASTQRSVSRSTRLVTPDNPTPMQREVPGAF